MSIPTQSGNKQQFSVLLDPKLIERVMEYTDTPGDAVEEGLKLWLAEAAAQQHQQPGDQGPAMAALPQSQPQLPGRSPANVPPRRRGSVVPSPKDYPPLTPTRSQTGAITPAASQNRSLDLAPPADAPGPMRRPFSRPNMPHKDRIPPRRRIDHLPIDKQRSSNDDETGWLV